MSRVGMMDKVPRVTRVESPGCLARAKLLSLAQPLSNS